MTTEKYRPQPLKMPKQSDRIVNVISIREPWIFAILVFGKRIENRNRRSNYRGKLYLHASKKYDREGHKWLVEQGYVIPEVKTGGIKASVDMIDCVEVDDAMRKKNIFAQGPYGLIFANPEPYPFLPCAGQLSIPFKLDISEAIIQSNSQVTDRTLYG